MRNLFEELQKEEVSLPILVRKAPDFVVVTTQGTLTLSDYEGTWLVLISHSADFTPVCTTEFIAFSEIYEELTKRNTEPLGLSVDIVSSHIAWIRNVEERMGVKILFPIIADLNKEVAKKYGMIHPEQSKTETVRCVFVIDTESKIRAMVYYPLTTGRNMKEVLRLIDALQTTDKHKVATPANWKPGDPLVVPPPATVEQAEERLKEGYDCKDWYLYTKKI